MTKTETALPTGTKDRIAMKDTDIAHLAGVIDADASIAAYIAKEDSSRLGYRVNPMVRLYRSPDDEFLLGKLDAYCEEYSVQYQLSERTTKAGSTRLRFQVIKPNSIERFLDPLLPYLTTKYEASVLIIEEILPRKRKHQHLNKDGFYELVGYVDKIRSLSDSSDEPKYDQEFFADEWGV